MAIVVVTSALVLLMPTLAFAQNPSFIGGNPTINKTISSYNATLSVSGNVTGLGNQVTAVYLATTNVTAETTCQNNNGTHSPGQTATFGTTTGHIKYITPRNGHITFNDTAPLSITVTDAPIDCPGDMIPVISSATFYDVTLYVQQARTTLAYNFGNVKDP